MEFREIVNSRYATKKFDGRQIPGEKIDALLELIRMAPSSFGLQPYKILVISDKKTKEKLSPASWNQPQITSCSHLLVFCANSDIKSHIDKYEQMMNDAKVPEENVKSYVGMMRGFDEGLSKEHKLSWSQRQTYIAIGNAVNGAKSLGFDSCPMEGFSPEEYSKILKLPENIVPSALVTLGYAADNPHPKIRYKKEDIFQSVGIN